MSDFFTQSAFNDPANTKKNNCIFKDLSPCYDHVSQYICNGHSEMIFELFYHNVSYTTGNNETGYKILTYITSKWNWSLPLFQNHETNIVSLDELYAFANGVSVGTNSKINAMKLFDILSSHMSLNAYVNHCLPKTWINEYEDNCVILTDEIDDPKIKFMYELPPLHRYLFAYIDNTQLIDGPNKTIRIDTISLIRSNARTSPNFVTINKPRILKYTHKKDCLATPLVLTSMRFLKPQDTKMTYTKSNKIQTN